jgi:leucyl/phenylalanyl-tRNA--protein transferase
VISFAAGGRVGGLMKLPFTIDPEDADEDGLVGVGGDLQPETLLAAYRRGIFPWFDDSLPVLWWSPDPRAIFELAGLHISRRLARTIRQGKFELTVNLAFREVMECCAERPGQGVWITADMIGAYTRLHKLGHAHSVEVWHNDMLAGGLYGVTIGGLFAGESMFTIVRDASKVALAFVMQRLRERRFQLFDVQFLNDHTERMGAVEIPRREYLSRLRRALKFDAKFV